MSDYEAGRVTSPRPYRLRMTDGTLRIGWPLGPATAAPGAPPQLLLAHPDHAGGPWQIALDDVMEVNDLPRSGPPEAVPLPTLGRRRRPKARAQARPRPVVPPKVDDALPRRKEMTASGRAVQVGVGYCGMWLGAVLGGGGVALATRDEDLALMGLAIGVPLGTALAIHSSGDQNHGHGSFGATLLGASTGTALAAVLIAKEEPAAIIVVPVAPLLGGILGYLVSDEGPKRRRRRS